jgi:RNA polymerase sigma-70 factor (ECF subfamily)
VADLPIGTVMSRLARGRRKLAALLGATPAAGASAGKAACESAPSQAPREAGHSKPPRQSSTGSPDNAERMAADNRSAIGGNPARATIPAAGKPATATVMPLRASANGRPLNIPGGSTAGPVRETPDEL